MVSTGVPSLDALLGSDGYPDRSAILVVGPPGIGKEALGYWFIRSGLIQGDYCLYATHRPVSDVLRDMKGVGIGGDRVPEWIASSGSPIKCDLRDSTSISFNIKEAVHRNKQRRVRVATDVLSPLLVLNPLESMYGYWSQLLSDLKQQDSVIFALAEEGMHPPERSDHDGANLRRRDRDETLRGRAGHNPALPRQEDARAPAASRLLPFCCLEYRDGGNTTC